MANTSCSGDVRNFINSRSRGRVCKFAHNDGSSPAQAVVAACRGRVRNSNPPPYAAASQSQSQKKSVHLRIRKTAPEGKTTDEYEERRPALKHRKTENFSHLGYSGIVRKPNMEDRVCKYWKDEACVYGDKCRYLHSWANGIQIQRMAQSPREHKKAVVGFGLPTGANKLFSGGSDGTLRAWAWEDNDSARCVDFIHLIGDEIGCVMSDGHWVFAGIPNGIRAWNVQTSESLMLEGPVGQVHAMGIWNGNLFAACQDGNILAYRSNSNPGENAFQLIATLTGHKRAVTCLNVNEYQVFSGSIDGTVRRWDMSTLECTHHWQAHSEAVTYIACLDMFLISASLDTSVKVWSCLTRNAIETNSFELVHTQNEQHGILAAMGMHNAAARPHLFVSLKDSNCVRVYELDKEKVFIDRGKLFVKKDVRALGLGEGGYFFTGDELGNIDVWKWL